MILLFPVHLSFNGHLISFLDLTFDDRLNVIR
jgi:hypothetical protein